MQQATSFPTSISTSKCKSEPMNPAISWWTTIKILFAFLVLCGFAFGELPDAPSVKLRAPVTANPYVVHNSSSYAPKFRDPIKDWKFWAGTGVLVGAMLYDQQQTLDG